MTDHTPDAVAWLLAAEEPAVRRLARRDLLGDDSSTDGDVTAGPWVSALLEGQQDDGGFGGNPYRTWTGTHWRLAEAVLSWQWPDGGWNCDNRADGHRSSFHESHRPAWAHAVRPMSPG